MTRLTSLALTLVASLALLCGASFAGHAATASASASGRQRLRMDGGWRFHLGDFNVKLPGTPITGWRYRADDQGDKDAAQMAAPDLDTSGPDWKPVQPGQDVFGGKRSFAWFRVTLPDVKGPGRRVYFSYVDDDATVYLNGKLMGQHSGYSDAFSISLDSAWREGGPNVLAVLVGNSGGGPGGLGKQVVLQSGERPPATGPAAAVYDDSGWRHVDLPHDFVVEGTFSPKADRNHGYLPVNVGWYRKSFWLPASDRGHRLWLEFDGIYRNSTVWVNGHYMGNHQSGYTSFYYDITPAARFGEMNEVAVRVDARAFEGWWYEGGGIYRHVWLVRTSPVHVAHWGTFVTSQVPGGNEGRSDEANVTIQTTVANDGTAAAAPRVVSRVYSPAGREVGTAEAEVDVAPGKSTQTTQHVHLTGPQLWSIETPNLYHLHTTILVDGKPADETRTTFGIRTIRFDPNHGFFLNGRHVKIKGTCNHQDFAGVGIALPDHCQVYKIEKLKQMGSNAYRCSHNPPAAELLDACDRLGMVVMDENRKLGDSDEILGQVRSMVMRDRNHPSIIMWSMCNEEWAYQGTPKGAEMFSAMKKVVRSLDPTRPVTCAMNGGFGHGISGVEDLQGFNYNYGAYDAFHKQFPNQPCFGSETASHVSDRGVYATDKVGGYVSAYSGNPEPSWKPVAERPWMCGSFVWTGFDYRGEPSPYNWPCINSHFGIMDTCGFPKDSWWYYKAWWGSKPIVHVFPHWNWKGREGQDIDVWCYGNTQQVGLRLNGKDLGTKDMPRWGHVEWKVPYEPGRLVAVGLNNGKIVTRDVVETTGQPARLSLSPDQTRIVADNEDCAIVAVSVLDAEGRVVPTADNGVVFTVKGPGRVAGVGNGDPSCHEPDRASRRHAFNGHCLVIVQATTKPGTITLEATSKGLKPASLTITTVAR